MKEVRISEAFDGDQGGTLVIADTKPQVLKACKGEMNMFLPLIHFWRQNQTKLLSLFWISPAIKEYRERVPGGKFILIVDEADDMFRSTERHQVFEQALQKLLRLNPSMASIRFLGMLIFN